MGIASGSGSAPSAASGVRCGGTGLIPEDSLLLELPKQLLEPGSGEDNDARAAAALDHSLLGQGHYDGARGVGLDHSAGRSSYRPFSVRNRTAPFSSGAATLRTMDVR